MRKRSKPKENPISDKDVYRFNESNNLTEEEKEEEQEEQEQEEMKDCPYGG